MKILELAEKVLSQENEPLSAREIWKVAINKGFVQELMKNKIHIFSIPSLEIWDMYVEGKLGMNAQLKRESFLKIAAERNVYERV